MQKRALKHRLLDGAFFAFFGPLFGLILVLYGLLLDYLYSADWSSIENLGRDLSVAGLVVFFGLGFSYLLGALPAFITGFIASFAPKKANKIMLATIAGAMICFIGYELIGAKLQLSIFLGVVGGASGFLCARLRLRRANKQQ